MSENTDYALYNTSLSFVAQIKAKSEGEAMTILRNRLRSSAYGDYDAVADEWDGSAFVSEPDTDHGWDGEKFAQIDSSEGTK